MLSKRISMQFKQGWLAAGIVCLFLLALHWLTPPYVLVTFPDDQRVITSNTKVGVHTRLTDEVETWKIQRSLQLVREMGAPWIVEYFPWAYIEPVQGQYTWEHSDRVIQHAKNQGLTVIARLGMVPEWAREDDQADQETTFTYLPPAHYTEFASFTEAFVARYKDDVTHVIIWNEPNLSFEWGFQTVSPEGYTALLAEAYAAAHRANPDVIVLGGALAPTLEPEGSPAGLNDLLFLEGMYAAGAGEYFDALAAHAYGLAFAPDIDPDPGVINFRRVELLRDIMLAHGDDKPVYITEAGWNDHPRWTWSVSPALRASYTLDAWTWAEVHWPWCPVVAMWMFRTPATMHNYQDYFAFVTPDFQLRPIYTVAQHYTGGNGE